MNSRVPVAFRLGTWFDPDHKIKYEGETVTLDGSFQATRFPGGDDELHLAAGFGLVFGEHFQIDFAADFSEFVSSASLSSAFRF